MVTVTDTFDGSTNDTDTCVGIGVLSNCRSIPGFVSYQTSLQLETLSMHYASTHGHLAITVCIFSVISNMAIIIVLTRQAMTSATNIISAWIAIFELWRVSIYIPFVWHFYLRKMPLEQYSLHTTTHFAWILYDLVFETFSVLCHNISLWFTTVSTVFHYIYTCYPNDAKRYCSEQRTKVVVRIIIFLFFILCLPHALLHTFSIHTTIIDPETEEISNSSNPFMANASWTYNLTNEDFTIQDNVHEDASPDVYCPVTRMWPKTTLLNWWIRGFVFKLMPCVLLFAMSPILVHATKRKKQRDLKSETTPSVCSSLNTDAMSTTVACTIVYNTRMLLPMVIIFTITELPHGILQLLNIFVPCFESVVYSKLSDILIVTALYVRSATILVYITSSNRFNRTFQRIFCPCLRFQSMNGSNEQ